MRLAWRRSRQVSFFNEPSTQDISGERNIDAPIIVGGQGCLVQDETGRTVLDFTSQGGLLGLGHQHPLLRSVAAQQLDGLWYIHGRYEFSGEVDCGAARLTVSRPALHKALRAVASRVMDVHSTHTSVSGSAAVMNALKICRIARVHHRASAEDRVQLLSGDRPFPAFAVVAFHDVYHGQLGEAHVLSATAPVESRGSTPGLHVRRVPPPFAWQPGFDRRAYHAKACKVLDETVAEFGWRALGIVFEPVGGQGEDYDPDALNALLQAARERGLYLIADEFKTGQGRVGRQFGCEYLDVRPDALVFSKILTGGFPGGAIAVGEKIDVTRIGLVPEGGTFSATPMTCAMMQAVLSIIEQDDLVARAHLRGGQLMECLQARLGRRKAIRFIRGKGLLVSLTIESETARDAVFREALLKGLLTFPTGRGWGTPRIVLMPPLVVSEQQIEEAAAILEAAVATLPD